MPLTKSVSQIKSSLLNPALTSHFEVEIALPSNSDNDFRIFLTNNGVLYEKEKLNLLCSEASLPGSSFTTHEITNDFHGVTERHAYRRVYDDRIDLTFYVDANNYLPIRFFETWMKWIANESIASDTGLKGTRSPEYFYRMRYPKSYRTEGMKIVKFERTGTEGKYTGSSLTYSFVGAYPISISSIPVSYDASSLLKCTVSMTYTRYIVHPSSQKEKEDKDIRVVPKPQSTITGDPSAPRAPAPPTPPAAVPTQTGAAPPSTAPTIIPIQVIPFRP
jgi:hypothetical protein